MKVDNAGFYCSNELTVYGIMLG